MVAATTNMRKVIEGNDVLLAPSNTYFFSVGFYFPINFSIWHNNCSVNIRYVEASSAGTYLQTQLRLPEFLPIGQWNRFK